MLGLTSSVGGTTYTGGLQISVKQDSGDNFWCSSSNESGDFGRYPKEKLITETKTEMGKVGWLVEC